MAQSGSGTGGAGKDLGRWEGRENSPVGGGGDPRAFPGLPPVLVQPPIGLNLSWCLWKALPKVSQNRLGFFRSAQLHLSLTLPSGHKEAVSCGGEFGGQLPSFRAHQEVSFGFPASRPCPHQVSLQPEKPQCLPLTLSRGKEARSAAGSPAVFHFQFAPGLSWGEDSERRFGKGGITLRAPGPSDP